MIYCSTVLTLKTNKYYYFLTNEELFQLYYHCALEVSYTYLFNLIFITIDLFT